MPNPFTLPPIPAELQAIIDADRERFAGWHMMADPPEGGTGTDIGAGAGNEPDKAGKKGGSSGADGADGGSDKADEPLGESGKKALDKERSQRKELEKQLAGVKAFQEGLAKLVNPEGGEKVAPEEALQKLAEKVDQLTHSNLVKDVAREFGITDKDDLNWLTEMKTEEQIRGLAERLKPADGDGNDSKKDTKRAPRPDPSAGKGGGDNGGKPSSVAEVMAARRAAREAKSKT